ncbi:DUF2515 domain-containing protein [Fredinandcohnia humi]
MTNEQTAIVEIEKRVMTRRKKILSFSNLDKVIIQNITKTTAKGNIDNISRTKSYARFYYNNKEIQWSFLASMVSRNAGYNMTDLEGEWFHKVLSKQERKALFYTFERANWLIFADAFPQLLLYEYSKKLRKPLFYLLPAFSVSAFIETEWEYFWHFREGKRLITSQIINEQNIIQQPVIEHPLFKQKVFHTLFYNLQDFFHFSSVIFPTLEGQLYGFSVHNFTKLDERIELGKKLASLLFHDKYYEFFYRFSRKVEHTGSRFDYEKYVGERRFRNTPFLRTTFPICKHIRVETKDWYNGERKKKWYKTVSIGNQFDLTNWFLKKQKQLQAGILIEDLLKNKD